MKILDLVKIATEKKASDIHITAGAKAILRINGQLVPYGEETLTEERSKEIIYEILDENLIEILESKGEVDSSFTSEGISRCRINVYKQRGSYSIAIRIIPIEIPSFEDLGLPEVISELSKLPRGLILVTGPTGSGKSTTLASIIDKINSERNAHILTLEDPIEYLHSHKNSIVTQREIGTDTKSFSDSLRSALRQDPDVILVGEMRDLETISISLTAAETGHLVLSTLHTNSAAKTIDRIIDVFPNDQQQQIRVQLATSLQAIISQQLLPTIDGKRVAAFEVMVVTPAIRNLIREDKIHQIDTAIQTGSKHKMINMDSYLGELFKKEIITEETAINQAVDQDNIKRYII